MRDMNKQDRQEDRGDFIIPLRPSGTSPASGEEFRPVSPHTELFSEHCQQGPLIGKAQQTKLTGRNCSLKVRELREAVRDMNKQDMQEDVPVQSYPSALRAPPLPQGRSSVRSVRTLNFFQSTVSKDPSSVKPSKRN